MSPPPDNVLNPKLYEKIKDEIHARLEKKEQKKEQKKGWGIHSSEELVKKYKARGGKYSGEKPGKDTGTARWEREKWTDEYGNPCGSKKNRGVKKCRPTIRINKSTPVTWGELSKRGEKEKVISEKKKVGMGKRAPAIKRSRNPQGQLEFKKNKPLYKVETSSRKGYKGMVYVMVNGKKVLKHFKDAKKMNKKAEYWSTKYKK